ncbi:MAG: DUF5337 family protein [Paracoccus sp. (in: a-proteobacteria)]|nr:DUF5337 family protein [Paracoccus sp. (in: a-proteobacteria)]
MPARRPDDSAQTRLVAVVLAATALLWLLANWIGRELGLPAHYAFLFDLAAIGGFVWSLLVAWRIWRRKDDMTGRPGKKG